jgi:hypothetical protein
MAPDPASRHGRAVVLPRIAWHQTRLPKREGSGVTTCPTTPNPPPNVGGLWRHHVSCGVKPRLLTREGSSITTCPPASDPTSQHGTTLASPCVPWHQTHLPMKEGSGVAMCPMAPDPPPSQRGKALALPRATRLLACYGHKQKGNT